MRDEFYALLGGLIILLLAFGAWLAIGSVFSQYEAIRLIETLSRSALYFGSATATASATILALMLTLVGMTNRAESDFDDGVYRRIFRVSTYATTTLCGSVVLLLALTFPVGEFENLPSNWYSWLYRFLFGGVSLLSAMLVATILLLFFTIRDVVRKITPSDIV
ncbi:hypothetical protein HFP57_09680 [Parasphingopyxis algicola]|uniref:hypothetical protein n=1 Tax=Parasphingopyxis algicola TaxID=2026624 RepID=UPI0015A21C87|nr:hypothetical protein [Parasphingopyxis algicola]QLC25262.1 hypothetical protein HFP57_09680 [Parasphingopyxis algicola]